MYSLSMANQPAAIAQALADHNRTKRSTDIPLFYGQPGKDTIAARLLIVRINDAATIATWNEARKLLEFKMCLRDKAVGWFNSKYLFNNIVIIFNFTELKSQIQ